MEFPAIGNEGSRLVASLHRFGSDQLDEDRVVGCRASVEDFARRGAEHPTFGVQVTNDKAKLANQ
jgi:hypothetical protein